MLFLDAGVLDMAALTAAGVSLPAILRRQLRALETVARLAAKHTGVDDNGERTRGPGYLFVIDVRTGTASRFLAGWKLWVSIASCEAKYFPALLEAVCVVRAPSFASWALGLCKKGFLDAATAEKVTLDCADDPTEALAAMMPPELLAQLPAAGRGAGRAPAAGSPRAARRR